MGKKGDRKQPGKGSRSKRPSSDHQHSTAKRSRPQGNKVVHLSEKRQTRVKFHNHREKQAVPPGEERRRAAPVTSIRRRRRLRFIPLDARTKLAEKINDRLRVKLRETAIAWRLRRAVKGPGRAEGGADKSFSRVSRQGEKEAVEGVALRPLLINLREGLRKWSADYRSRQGKARRRTLNIEGIASLLLAVLLFYPPFFKGLTGAREMMVTHIATAAVWAAYACYRLVKRDTDLAPRPLDYAILLLLGLYLTSGIRAADSGAAVSAILNIFNYAAVYWLLSNSLRSIRGARRYLAVLFASGVGVGLISLGTAFGTLDYPNAFAGGRLFTTLQHPNSAASWLGALNLIGLYLWATAKENRSRMLMAASNYLLLIAITGTGSRGGLLIYPLGLILLLAGLPGRDRLRCLGCLAIEVAAVALTAENIFASAGGEAKAAGWVWLVLGGVLVGGVQYLWSWLETISAAGTTAAGKEGERSGPNLKLWKIPLITLTVILLLAGGELLLANAMKSDTAGKETAPARLTQLDSVYRSTGERLIWSRDAWRIIMAGPANALLGTGGGGWQASYHRYQSYLYSTGEIYNHLLQVGVETGLPGMLAYLAIWFYFAAGCWQSWLNCKRGEGGAPDGAVVPLIPYQSVRGTVWTVFSGAAVLGLHSLIDYNLSVGAVSILLWALLGIGRGLEHLYGGTEPPQKVYPRELSAGHYPIMKCLAVVGCAMIVGYISLAVLEGINCAAAAEKAADAGDTQGAVSRLESALTWDRWNKDYPARLSQLLFYRSEAGVQRELSVRAEQLAGTAAARGRDDAGSRLNYARILLANSQYRAGIRELEEAAAALPYDQGVYDNLAAGYLYVGKAALASGDEGGVVTPEEGRAYLAGALALPRRISELMRAVPPEGRRLWSGAPLLTPSAHTYLQAGEAAVLLGRGEAANYLRRASVDPNLKAEALLWQGLDRERNRRGSGRSLIKQALADQPSLEADYRQAVRIREQ